MISKILTKEVYFITCTVIDWMDVFTRPKYKHIVVDSLRYCQANKGLEIYAWVLMSNHLHMIASTNGNNKIEDVLRDFKKFTSKGIVKSIEDNPSESRKEWIINRCSFRGTNDSKIKKFKFWQDGNHIETIYSYDFFKVKFDYIHMNPVKQEIVERPEHYLFSSARYYYGEKGLLDITILK